MAIDSRPRARPRTSILMSDIRPFSSLVALGEPPIGCWHMADGQEADFYAVLGIPRHAEPEDIRRAYRERAKVAHPDAGGSSEAFRAVQDAYTVLSDPEQRGLYDAWLNRNATSARAAAGGHDEVLGLLGQLAEIRAQAQRALLIGLAWLAGGAIISFGTYAAAASSESGGHYTVLWGAMAVGALRMFRALQVMFAAWRAKAEIVSRLTGGQPRSTDRRWIVGVIAALSLVGVVAAVAVGAARNSGSDDSSALSAPDDTEAAWTLPPLVEEPVAAEEPVPTDPEDWTEAPLPTEAPDPAGNEAYVPEPDFVPAEEPFPDECWLVQIASTRSFTAEAAQRWAAQFQPDTVAVVTSREWPGRVPPGSALLVGVARNRANAYSIWLDVATDFPDSFVRSAPPEVCWTAPALNWYLD